MKLGAYNSNLLFGPISIRKNVVNVEVEISNKYKSNREDVSANTSTLKSI
jgi:hypothetical protein